jgi:hypothetical protein
MFAKRKGFKWHDFQKETKSVLRISSSANSDRWVGRTVVDNHPSLSSPSHINNDYHGHRQPTSSFPRPSKPSLTQHLAVTLCISPKIYRQSPPLSTFPRHPSPLEWNPRSLHFRYPHHPTNPFRRRHPSPRRRPHAIRISRGIEKPNRMARRATSRVQSGYSRES